MSLAGKYPHIDPFVISKWERAFHVFFEQQTRAGQPDELKWHDFFVVIKKVRELYGQDSKEAETAKKMLHVLWDKLREKADRNKDKAIDMDEWGTLLSTHDINNQSSWFTQYATFLFKLFDVSDDGLLDIAEYTDGMSCYGHEEHSSHAAFHKFAVDKDGKPQKAIHFDRFKELWGEYFYSTNKNAPGNHLFGIVEG